MIADARGPVLVARVDGVVQVPSVAGRAPSSDGDLFLDVALTVELRREITGIPATWKVFGAQEVSTPGWPVNPIDLRHLGVGRQTGHIGLEVPASGQVLLRILNTTAAESPQFELRAAAAATTPAPDSTASHGDWLGLAWGVPSVLPPPAGQSANPVDVAAFAGGCTWSPAT